MRIVIYLYSIVANGGIYLNAEVYHFHCSVLLQTVFTIEQVERFKIKHYSKVSDIEKVSHRLSDRFCISTQSSLSMTRMLYW